MINQCIRGKKLNRRRGTLGTEVVYGAKTRGVEGCGTCDGTSGNPKFILSD